MKNKTQNGSVVTADGICEAANRIRSHIVKTPLIENAFLNELAGGRIFIKAETLQHCGSFKVRGAFNRLSQLSNDEKKRGVLAWSSGNHAQGIARAAKHFGVAATIIMPADTPDIKMANVKRYGAKTIPYDRYTQDREKLAEDIINETGMVLAPSFDHVDIIEGQGTLALEVLDALQEQNVSLDGFIACCGGGGLTAGCATLLNSKSPNTEMWIAEPEGFDETWASIRDKKRRYADVSKRTICDAIATPTPGRLTLPIMEQFVRGGVSLSEADVGRAIAFAYKQLKLVVEPGGAVALAAILSKKYDAQGKNVAITLSGGNVDSDLFSQLLKEHS